MKLCRTKKGILFQEGKLEDLVPERSGVLRPPSMGFFNQLLVIPFEVEHETPSAWHK